MQVSARYKRFMERLKTARKEAGLTQKEVARLLGVSQSFVSKCEAGERRVDVVELAEYAKLYRRPLEYFAGDERLRIRRGRSRASRREAEGAQERRRLR